MRPWVLLALPLCSPSFAQEKKPDSPPVESIVAEEKKEAPPPTEADIKMNFASVVETYIRQNSPDGFWKMKDSRNGHWFRVKLKDIDKESVAPAEEGAYKGRATVVGLAGKPELKVDFTVDFSGLWSVKKYEAVSDEDAPEAEEAAALSPAAFSAIVKRYVRAGSRKPGVFAFKDAKLKKVWKLKLKKIHADALQSVTDDRFFACVDFKEAAGRSALDLDFYVSRKDSNWAVDEAVLHSVDGKPRFTYDETNQRVPAD